MAANTMWKKFGFRETPYRTTPLAADDRDLELFAERDRGESAKFLTAMDSTSGSVVVVSGDIGIGKTSFVNIQQHKLATGAAAWGPRLLPCIEMTPLMEDDAPISLSQRITHNTVQNVRAFCSQHNKTIPPECDVIYKWLSHTPTTAGYSLTIGPLGYGRSWSLPPVADATLETWRAILKVIAGEVRTHLERDGCIVCLDNAETLTHTQLAAVLMAFRDMLFSIEGIWWVLIGQSDLYSEIDSIDRRVSQRISGDGIELSHFTVEEFHDLIERRVRVYRNQEDAVSPLSRDIHDLLFSAACGELRFVFDTAGTLVQEVVTAVREETRKQLPKMKVSDRVVDEALTAILGKILIDRQIPDNVARRVLQDMTRREIGRLRKNERLAEALRMCGEGAVEEGDYGRFGHQSASEFRDVVLEPLRASGFLCRRAEAYSHKYYLKGFGWMCREFGLWGG